MAFETEGLTAQVRARVRREMLKLVAVRNTLKAQKAIMEHVNAVTQYVMDRVQVESINIIPGEPAYDSSMTVEVNLPWPHGLPCICYCGETMQFNDFQIHLNEHAIEDKKNKRKKKRDATP